MILLEAFLLSLGIASAHTTKLAPTSVPVTVVPNTYSDGHSMEHDTLLVVDVAVGTPAQRMNLTLDEGNDISVLFDSTPSGNKTCYSFLPRHYFDGRASSTFKQTNKLYGDDGLWFLAWPYTSDCVIGTWGPSNVAVDKWQVGTLASQKLPFMYGRNLSSLLSPQWKSDGVFGLALWFHTPLSSKDGSTTEVLLSRYPEQVVSLYLQRRTAPVNAPALAGSLTIGGKDNQHCSQWTSLPFDPDALGWGATFDSAQLGPATFTGAYTAYFVLTTEYIKTANFDSIVRVLGAEYDFRSDQYTVRCDAVASLPDLVFKLSGTEFRIPASDYARQIVDTPHGRCALLIESSIDPDAWILGTTFLRPYCLAFDFANIQVAIGNAA